MPEWMERRAHLHRRGWRWYPGSQNSVIALKPTVLKILYYWKKNLKKNTYIDIDKLFIAQ